MSQLDIAVKNEDIIIKQGDDQAIVFAVTKADGTAADLSSGYTAKLQARVNRGDAETVVAISNTTGITLANGSITVLFTHAASALLDFATAIYELQVTKTAGGFKKTVRYGRVVLRKDIVYV